MIFDILYANVNNDSNVKYSLRDLEHFLNFFNVNSNKKGIDNSRQTKYRGYYTHTVNKLFIENNTLKADIVFFFSDLIKDFNKKYVFILFMNEINIYDITQDEYKNHRKFLKRKTKINRLYYI